MTITGDTLVLHFRLVGVLMAWLVAVNLIVPGLYRWREELSRVSLLNRQIFQAHNVFLILSLALLSVLLLGAPESLLEPTRLSRAVLSGLTIVWALRMLMQWFFYSPEIWRGHRFNSAMHCVFSAIWVYVTAVFGLALWTVVR